MSLWADYVFERDGTECVEDAHGFMTFKIQGEECYIEDAFIVPSQREKGFGSELLSAIEKRAKEAGCKYLTSRIRPSETFATVSMRAQLARGFKIFASFENRIVMIKELS